MTYRFIWKRYGGYECSTKGDKRFSAFCATLPDNRTIEQHYQCDIKGYDIGGTNWKLGKGKPSLFLNKDLYSEYLDLWLQWAEYNLILMIELHFLAKEKQYILSDCFANSNINQARALADILNILKIE